MGESYQDTSPKVIIFWLFNPECLVKAPFTIWIYGRIPVAMLEVLLIIWWSLGIRSVCLVPRTICIGVL